MNKYQAKEHFLKYQLSSDDEFEHVWQFVGDHGGDMVNFYRLYSTTSVENTENRLEYVKQQMYESKRSKIVQPVNRAMDETGSTIDGISNWFDDFFKHTDPSIIARDPIASIMVRANVLVYYSPYILPVDTLTETVLNDLYNQDISNGKSKSKWQVYDRHAEMMRSIEEEYAKECARRQASHPQ